MRLKFALAALALCWALPASAQQPASDSLITGKDGVSRFDGVKVDTITPKDLSDGVTIESAAQVIKRPLTLAPPPDEDALKATVTHLIPRVVQLVAIQMPPEPFAQIPVIARGHGVWVQAGEAPMLISSLFWLEDASEVYLVPHDASAIKRVVRGVRRAQGASEVATRSVTVSDDARAFEREKRQYTRISPVRRDRHRNLVAFEVPEAARPESGLALFDTSRPLGSLYGYVPQHATALSPANILPQAPAEPALKFYFMSDFPGVLGAPLVTQEGELVVLNAMRHPKLAGIALAIPPHALKHFITPAPAP